jgi:hypothetical protein
MPSSRFASLLWLFGYLAPVLLYVLAVAGVGELAVYVAQEYMSQKEANAFSERVANMMETMQNLYSTEGSLRNVALDHLGVMRYPECKEVEE